MVWDKRKLQNLSGTTTGDSETTQSIRNRNTEKTTIAKVTAIGFFVYGLYRAYLASAALIFLTVYHNLELYNPFDAYIVIAVTLTFLVVGILSFPVGILLLRGSKVGAVVGTLIMVLNIFINLMDLVVGVLTLTPGLVAELSGLLILLCLSGASWWKLS